MRQILYVISVLFFYNSCQSQKYDPELMKPDIDAAGVNHGYTYTPLGCLLAFPWEYQGEVSDTSSETRTYSVTSQITDQYKKDLVFELQRNGTLKFWFKKDYIIYPTDTITQLDGIKTVSKKILKSEDLKIKKIYNTGSWQANFNDSSIKIDFGKNNFGLTTIEGKLYSFDANEMCIVKNSIIEMPNDIKKNRIVSRLRSCFIH